MILIISASEDHSTKDVIEWLIKFNQPFFIIHPEDKIDFKFINNNITLRIENTEISLKDIKSVWYRRGYINLAYTSSENPDVNRLLKEEYSHLKNFIYHVLENKRHINKRRDNDINKLIALSLAKKHGLDIPQSFYNTNEISAKDLITKPIAGSGSYRKNGQMYVSYTTEVTKEDIDHKFQYRYFQEKIAKKYELRIFYLHGKFWSMAIFSQRDPQTRVDLRRYNGQKPNRNVPYRLPKEIEVKLDYLTKELNINSGSIDMIVTKENKFCFLEVNPIGQFGMTSFPCNYHIEKEIAEFLTYERS